MPKAKLHVAIIMDGNGRWANARGWPRIAGHRSGADSVRRIVEAAPKLGIGVLTLYAFSSDNWKRPQGEVRALMGLLRRYLLEERERCIENGIRVRLIGRRDRLPRMLTPAIEAVEAATAHGKTLELRLAIDYSSRDALLDAAKKATTFTRDEFSALLGGSEVDLVIRTSGEQRLSDFLLWESAYAELYFTPTMWPDFGEAELAAALQHFRSRERRYGRIAAAKAV